ncbi:MAG: aspartate kinase [Erysipelotrichaceae bacterium]|nr:aspartate kinase [Erysipelotrichaceae bacterium]MDY4641982.1 aspartate kinase [Erysipelotrichaceae bacterium]MDY5653268.1 aspartate kinase [Erysipelotrichaceae bacterium]
MIKVCKFGGSSVADAGQFLKIKNIVKSDMSRKFVVVSAVGKANKDDHKITDLLYVLYSHVKYGVDYESILKIVEDKYNAIKNELGLSINLDAEFDEIRKNLNKHCDVDYVVSRGEYLSAKLMADYLGGIFVDAKDVIFFGYDNKFYFDKIEKALEKYEGSDKVIVVPGFYGSLPNGKIRCMSRGGSDITGAVIANVVNASVYENFTDVSGIMVADPRIVDKPVSVKRITYAELREMSYMGASVLHDEAIFPVKAKNIPLNILNTNDPSHPGTMILETCDEYDEKEEPLVISGITGKKGFSSIFVAKSHIASEVGVLKEALDVISKYNISVESVATGIDSFSIVVESERVENDLYDLMNNLGKVLETDNITIEDNMAMVAIVGRKLKNYKGFSGKLFSTLGKNDINIKLISQTSDEISIILGVDEKNFEKTINVVYKGFIK